MPLEPLFQPGDIWFGGGCINTGGEEPCVIAKDMDDACRIAAERMRGAEHAS